MTQNSKNVFYFLRDNHDVRLTANEIAQNLNISIAAVTGSVNGLCKKGYAQRTEETVTNADGKTSVIKYISLTDEGMAFDPEKAEAEEAAAKAAAKAAKQAAKDAE